MQSVRFGGTVIGPAQLNTLCKYSKNDGQMFVIIPDGFTGHDRVTIWTKVPNDKLDTFVTELSDFYHFKPGQVKSTPSDQGPDIQRLAVEVSKANKEKRELEERLRSGKATFQDIGKLG
ncbi:MAG: hypothetical protein K2X66_02105 [Cyanobacteria bacterium]|nr:hypothetical protein [Cyanobacteriota bacterium]